MKFLLIYVGLFHLEVLMLLLWDVLQNSQELNKIVQWWCPSGDILLATRNDFLIVQCFT